MKDPRWNASGNTVSSLSETKEMEGKLIGTVNVNTWIDVRDRKSGLVNWLTVSLLYPLLSLFLLFPSSLFSSLFRADFTFSLCLWLQPYAGPVIVLCYSFLSFFVFLVSPLQFIQDLPSDTVASSPTVGIERSILHLATSLDFWFEWLQSNGIRFLVQLASLRPN